MSNTTIYFIVVAFFMLCLFVIGLITSKTIKDPDDWVVANQSLGVIPLSGTYFATIVSAASIVSYMGYYYLQGWSGMWNFAGTLVTSFLAAIWVAKKMRSFGMTTFPEYIDKRFGSVHSFVSCIIILIGSIALMTAQVKASVVVMQAMVDWNEITISMVVLFVFVLFTAMGGMKAVAWTDTVCAYVIIIGIWAMAINFLGQVGGFSSMMSGVKAINPNFVSAFSSAITPVTAIGWTATWGICNFGAPQFVGRFLSATTPESAAKSQAVTAVMLGIFYLPLLLVGISGMLILPGIEKQDMVFISLVTQTIHPVLGGVMFSAVIAAIISTADSLLLLASTTWTRDIWKKFVNPDMDSKKELNMSRVSTIIIGILGVLMSFVMNDAIQFIQARGVTLMGSSMAMLVLIGAFNKKVTSAGALSSMIVGFVAANVWYALGQPFGIYAALPGSISAAVVLLVVSKFTKPMSREELAPFFPEVIKGKN